MTPESGLAVGVGLLAGLIVLLATPQVLRRLPEPPPEPDEKKLPYAALAGRSFATGCALIAVAVVGLGWALSPVPARPLWLVLGTTAVVLAAVDARTTWLPLPLTRAAWALMAAATIVAGVLGGPGTVLRITIGAGVAGGLYLVVWLVSRGGFGFGDVRFAPLVGSAGAAHSFTMLLWTLVLGSLAGAGHGLFRLARRRRTPFPYAPAILAGAYLALAVNAAVRT